MRATVDHKALKNEMPLLITTANHRSNTLPVLGMMEVTATSNLLSLRATNLESMATVEIPAQVEKEGICLVPVKQLAQLLKGKGESVILYTDPRNANVGVQVDNTDYMLVGVKDEFPKARMVPAHEWRVEAPALAKAVRQVEPAVARDDTRPVLAAMHLRFENNLLTLEAADSFRLHQTQVGIASIRGEAGDRRLLPSGAIKPLQTILKGYTGTVEIGGEEHFLHIRAGGRLLQPSLTQGTFPDTNRLIPTRDPMYIVVEQAVLLGAATSAAPMSKQYADILELVPEEGNLIVEAGSERTGIFRSPIAATLHSQHNSAINVKYLIETLNAFGPGPLSIQQATKNTPYLFTREGEALKVVLIPIDVGERDRVNHRSAEKELARV